MNCIIIDEREKFLSDIETRMLIDDERNVEILALLSSIDKLDSSIAALKPDVLVVSSNIVESQENWEYKGIKVVGFAVDESGNDLLEEYGIPSYGVVTNTKFLLNMMEGPIPTLGSKTSGSSESSSNKKAQNKKAKNDDVDDVDDSDLDDYDQDEQDDRRENTRPSKKSSSPRYDDEEEEDDRPRRSDSRRRDSDDEDDPVDDRDDNRRQQRRRYDDDYDNNDDRYDDRRRDDRLNSRRPDNRDRDRNRDYEDNRRERRDDSDRRNDRNNQRSEQRDRSQDRDRGRDRDRDDRNDRTSRDRSNGRQNSQNKNQGSSSRNAKLPQVKGKIQDTRQENDSEFEDDFLPKPSTAKKAKVVTVYSAKGGVGKTTIATELAVYLSLTSSGRGRLRVCIVDYNIDFGDVRSVLGMPADGPDMSSWAMDIRERIEDGENPKEISYTKDEIKDYLQVMDRCKLRALLAPITHEDSMDIGRKELDIMLRNIIENGGFDFVVCDTGNNTRDSSVYALEAADTILLVSTQDATAATCNTSSMEALQKYGLDLRKVRMVINNCMSSRITGISVKEVEEAFLYPCIARIPHDMSVIRSNNLSVPVVYQANHDVTAAIRKIVNYLLDKKAVKTLSPKKTSFFKSLFGGK